LDKKVVFNPKHALTNQCTRIATARFYNGYTLTKKWVIVAAIASPQSRDFKRWADNIFYQLASE